MDLQKLKTHLQKQKGKQEQIENTIEKYSTELKALTKDLKHHEQAREIVRAVGLKTQQQLQYHINDITSLALSSVFEEPYKLEIEFVQRRNKTECDIYFVRNGEKIHPMTASGGGTVDVASFALRIASWSMQYPRSRNVIILDEPLRFISEGLKEKASQMIKEISDKLNIQFIIITHEPKLAIYADKVFGVSIKNGVSKVYERD